MLHMGRGGSCGAEPAPAQDGGGGEGRGEGHGDFPLQETLRIVFNFPLPVLLRVVCTPDWVGLQFGFDAPVNAEMGSPAPPDRRKWG